jgi:hypothetical protein
VVDLTEVFSGAELEEWKDTLVSWEARDTIEDPENVEEWIDELEDAFRQELKGQELDEETVRFWREKLKAETKKARRAYLKEQEDEQKAKERREKARETFFELRAQGLTVSEIAKRLKVKVSELVEIALEGKGEKFQLLQNVQNVRLDELRERSGVKKAQRIELLGGQYRRILDELKKRKFEDVPTEKLLDYALKYSEILKREDEELTLTRDGDTIYSPVQSLRI